MQVHIKSTKTIQTLGWLHFSMGFLKVLQAIYYMLIIYSDLYQDSASLELEIKTFIHCTDSIYIVSKVSRDAKVLNYH